MKKILKLGLIATVLTLSVPIYAQSPVSAVFDMLSKGINGNNQQTVQQNRGDANSVMSIGGGLAKEAQKKNQGFDFSSISMPDAPDIAPEQEYRGYNGRTVEQAFLGCKYESYRAASPGLKRMGLMEKIRIRTYTLDSCMNKEGFFRQKGSLRVPSLEHLTAADFGF